MADIVRDEVVKIENRSQRTENRSQKIEVREQKSEKKGERKTVGARHAVPLQTCGSE